MRPQRKYYSIIDKVYRMDNLYEAWNAVKANKGSAGVDGETILWFETQLNQNLLEIQRLLKEGRYQPQPVLRHYIPKDNGKKRPLGIPTVRDRIVQQAVRQMIEPLFDRDFYPHSYGFRKGHSQHQALDIVRRAKKSGYEYVVDLDIQSYFDNIPHELLMKKIKDKVTDGKVLDLIEMWLKAGVLEDDQFHYTNMSSTQGGVISPLLANIYLDEFDWEMNEEGFPVVRFADDAIIFCKTQNNAKRAYKVAKQILEQKLQLTMHPIKTKIVHFDEGFRFLGFDFWKDYMVLPEDRIRKYKEKIRNLSRRQQGKSLIEMIQKLNEVIRGFSNYFMVGNVKSKFKRLDEWIRMRVRAYMRKKRSMESNWRIPNKALAQAGLVSMVDLLTYRS
ncbi:group II intron reverse transcriptase/maturase [Aquibacillus sp. 3ASR75-11]|uniref:Group II intron reverse transcriptase/maturase n=2 Tax=Terrihalobacillus insolitus TaxID=2950438 RepID=A0A9X3WSI7_9BACI|nr:group II intron reverse transcriptase/maturase [Terrihalobacillus insolitus]MDC3424048.1 group II intron reverse transcriptase/maturase [Terrihalobacillus insolitus]